jgi:hypothetical protein
MTDQPVLTDVQLRLMNTLAAERLAATEGRDAWRQGWHARASWSTDRAGWQAKGTEYDQTVGIEYGTDPEPLVKAREYIRCYDGGSRHHGCGTVVSLDELLSEIDDLIPITPELQTVLSLFYDLWNDPNINPVDDDKIEFIWDEKGKRR